MKIYKYAKRTYEHNLSIITINLIKNNQTKFAFDFLTKSKNMFKIYEKYISIGIILNSIKILYIKIL